MSIVLSRFLPATQKKKNCGYAVDRGEVYDGFHCVSAPILNGGDDLIAELTITGLATRIDAKSFSSLARVVLKQAAALSRRLEHRMQGEF